MRNKAWFYSEAYYLNIIDPMGVGSMAYMILLRTLWPSKNGISQAWDCFVRHHPTSQYHRSNGGLVPWLI